MNPLPDFSQSIKSPDKSSLAKTEEYYQSAIECKDQEIERLTKMVSALTLAQLSHSRKNSFCQLLPRASTPTRTLTHAHAHSSCSPTNPIWHHSAARTGTDKRDEQQPA